MFNNLRELIVSMPDENTCKAYLAKQRWNGNTVCPYCGHLKCYTIEGGRRYKCADKNCFKRFTVTVGTIFEASNIPLNKWFPAIYLATAHKKGISSYQLAKDIGVTQKTAWFMLHRIREILRVKTPITIGLNNPVEADEMFVGGSISNKHNKVRKMYADNPQLSNKTPVLGMIERDGILVANVIRSHSSYELAVNVAATVEKNATLITDETNLYYQITSNYNHQSVNHTAKEFVKEGNIHTNTIEGAFSHFKRMVYGIYHQITPKHTQRYLDEFTYRYNSRKVKDANRFEKTFDFIECRLKYKNLVAIPVEIDMPITNELINKGKGVFQMKDGEVLGHYATLTEANKATKIPRYNIRLVCTGKRKTAGGFQWCFA